MRPLSPTRWHSAPPDAVPSDDGWLSEAEREVQTGLRFAPRRATWRLGRWTAKQAILRFLDRASVREIEVLAAADGAPEAYERGVLLPFTLSLSHKAHLAVAAIAPRAMGIDLEAIEPRPASMLDTFFTEAEREAVRASARPDEIANALWSAKESALKRVREGLRRDTRGVQVALRDSSIGPWTALEVEDLELGARYTGWWRTFDGHVLTVVDDGPPPEPL